MKVKMKICLAGPRVHHGVGEIVSFDDETAARLIKLGYAIPAPLQPVERADAPAGNNGGKKLNI